MLKSNIPSQKQQRAPGGGVNLWNRIPMIHFQILKQIQMEVLMMILLILNEDGGYDCKRVQKDEIQKISEEKQLQQEVFE